MHQRALLLAERVTGAVSSRQAELACMSHHAAR